MVGVTLRMPLAAIKHFLPMDKKQITPQLPHEELLQLKRWNHADHLQWIGTASQHGLVPDRDQSRGDDGFHGPDGPLLGNAKRPRAEEQHEID